MDEQIQSKLTPTDAGHGQNDPEDLGINADL